MPRTGHGKNQITRLFDKDYRRAQHDLQELYRDKQKWNHMSLKNISNAGIFSADRSIMDYARDIWGATPVK